MKNYYLTFCCFVAFCSLLVVQSASAEERQGVALGEVAVDQQTNESQGGTEALDAWKLKIPFSAKKLEIAVTSDQLGRIEKLLLSYSRVDSGTVVGIVPVQWINELDEHGISYDVISEEPHPEGRDKRVWSQPRHQELIDNYEFQSKGCSWIFRDGDEGYAYVGNWAIPGECDYSFSVHLSPGALPGTAAWYYDMCQPVCVDQLTSVQFYIHSEERCWLGACIDPPVGMYNWSTDNWDYNWSLPKPVGTHVITLSASQISTYVGYPCGVANLAVAVPLLNHTCVDWADAYYCYTDEPPVCYVSRSSIPFADTYVGNSRSSTFYVKNYGCATLSGTVSESSPDFRVTANDGSLSYSLGYNESETFTVYFEPQSCGYKSTTINTGSSLCDDIPVSGTGIDDPECYVSESSIPFPDTYVGDSRSETFYIRNDGCGTLSGTVSEGSSHFRVTANDGSLSYSLGEDESETFTVYFEPQSCGYKSTTINTGSSQCDDIPVSGTGIDDPECYVSPTDIPFPETDVGDSESRTFYIRNDGCGTLSGTVSETSNHFRVTASGGLGYSLGEDDSKTFTVYFEPLDGGPLSVDVETGNSRCPPVHCHGTGIAHGYVEGLIRTTSGTGVSGVSVCVTGNGINRCDVTLTNGSYYIDEVPYSGSPYTVTPTLSGHEFDPPAGSGRFCLVNDANPVCTKDFTDVTAYTIAGHVNYTTCNDAPVEGVAVWVGGSAVDVTDPSGYYETSAVNGPVSVQAVLVGHVFLDPNPRLFDLNQDRYDIDFYDNTRATVSGRCHTGCDDPIVGAIVTLSGLDFQCQVEAAPTGADGHYSIDVPPGSYTACATAPGLEFACEDIDVPPEGLQHDFIPQTHLKLILEPGDPGDPSCPGLLFIESGQAHEYTVYVLDELDCPVPGATVTIRDDVSNTEEGTPAEQVFPLGDAEDSFVYTMTGGRPGLNKHLQMEVTKSGYDNANNEPIDKVISVTGRLWLGEAFTLSLPDATPLLVVYDPPGDGSYASHEASRTFYAGFGLHLGLEVGGDLQVHAGGALVGGTVGGELSITASVVGRYDYSWEMTSTRSYETSSEANPLVLGPGGGTHFLCAGLKLRYGEALEYYWDPDLCQIASDVVLSYEPDPDQSEVIPAYLSAYSIENEIIPPLPDEDQVPWQRLLAYDVTHDYQILPDEYELLKLDNGVPVPDEQIWSGGGGTYEYTTLITSSHRFTIEAELIVEASLAYEYGLDILGLLEGGLKAVVRSKMTVGGYIEGGIEHANTIDYRFTDDDPNDLFHTLVYEDASFGTPVFLNGEGTRTMCPWESPSTEKNEDVDLVNSSGIWSAGVCDDPLGTVCINYELLFTGLLQGIGSEFEVFAPTEENLCGAAVTFNGQGSVVAHVDNTEPFLVSVCVTPNPSCEVNELVIRARSTCDDQIFSDDNLEISVGPEYCTDAPQIVTPTDGSLVSCPVAVIAQTNYGNYDGLRFQGRPEGGNLFSICYDTDPEGSGPYTYDCSWDCDLYDDGYYYLIVRPESGGIIDYSLSDSVRIRLDATCPTVVDNTPPDGGNYSGIIQAEFSELMNDLSVNCASFLVHDLNTATDIPCDVVTMSDRFASFVPQAPLVDDHDYEGRVLVTATDLAGNPLCAQHTWSFANPSSPGPCLDWAGETYPGFEDDGLNPETGSPTTLFVFRVKYSDPDGTEPGADFPKVIISDGSESDDHVMYAINSDPFTTGRVYEYSGFLGVGTYTYQFWAENLSGDPATGPGSLEQPGPTVSLPGWSATIDALGEQVGGAVYEADVTIGCSDSEDRLFAPPAPPEFTVLMQLWDTDWNGPWSRDIRVCGDYECWVIEINPHGNVPPPDDRCATLSWNPAELNPDKSFMLKEGYECTDGSIVVSDMHTTTEHSICGPNSTQYFTVVMSECMPVTYDLPAGWSIISLPILTQDTDLSILFPTAEVAYGFDGSVYYPTTTLNAYEGYWIKVPSAVVREICGQPIASCSEHLLPGWHLKGGPSCVCTPDTDPPGCLEAIFGFSGSYDPVTQFEPTKGYWAKLSSTADFIRECGSGVTTKLVGELSTTASVDAEIVFTASGSGSDGVNICKVMFDADANKPSIPAAPAPPEYSVWMELYSDTWNGPFYKANSEITNNSWILAIDVGGASQSNEDAMATLAWNPADFQSDTYRMIEGYSGAGAVLVKDLASAAELIIEGHGIHYVTLARTSASESATLDSELPSDFALHRCYPNPFNPQVTIRFELPLACDVDLAVFDIVGRRVQTLTKGYMSAGTKTITWDGTNRSGSKVSSGVYFYRLTAGDFAETKKMVLLR